MILPQVRLSTTCLSTKSLGIKRVNQYILLKTLGTGSTSSVVQCLVSQDQHKKDGKYYAMKIIKRSRLKASEEIKEFEALKKLHHPYIIRLHEIIDDPKERSLYLVMDLLEGGTIDDKISES